MARAILLMFFLLTPLGCALPPERAAPPLLPDENAVLPYAELVTRARAQAAAANEAFYVDSWDDLENAAKGLEQTAHVLTNAAGVPAKHKDILAVEAGDLGREAAALRSSAKAKETTAATTALQRIHLKIRELRPDA
jgi:hypothetical protein